MIVKFCYIARITLCSICYGRSPENSETFAEGKGEEEVAEDEQEDQKDQDTAEPVSWTAEQHEQEI